MIQKETLSPCTFPSLISMPSCLGGIPATLPVRTPSAAFRSNVRLSTGPPWTSKDPFHLPVASAANEAAASRSKIFSAMSVRFMGDILSLERECTRLGSLNLTFISKPGNPANPVWFPRSSRPAHTALRIAGQQLSKFASDDLQTVLARLVVREALEIEAARLFSDVATAEERSELLK